MLWRHVCNKGCYVLCHICVEVPHGYALTIPQICNCLSPSCSFFVFIFGIILGAHRNIVPGCRFKKINRYGSFEIISFMASRLCSCLANFGGQITWMQRSPGCRGHLDAEVTWFLGSPAIICILLSPPPLVVCVHCKGM